jgi:hypothetical protein
MSQYFSFIDTGLLDKKISSGQFPFSNYLFWDTSLEMIDARLHKNYIIERVLSKGFLSDFYLLLKMYSRDEIVLAIKKSRVLDKKTINFCSFYFNVPINELHASPFYS